MLSQNLIIAKSFNLIQIFIYGSGFLHVTLTITYFKITFGNMGSQTDLEKVVNRPQTENSELHNVLKIA